MNITCIGIDLAKHVFQIHGVDNTGKTMVREQENAINYSESIESDPIDCAKTGGFN